jgi:hypothetical protein
MGHVDVILHQDQSDPRRFESVFVIVARKQATGVLHVMLGLPGSGWRCSTAEGQYWRLDGCAKRMADTALPLSIRMPARPERYLSP